MNRAAATNNAPRLRLGERIEIIKNKNNFTLLFCLSILLLIVVVFGIATGGGFFKKSVILGIVNQGMIVATMAAAVSFIYSTGNLDISIGHVMTLGACLGSLIYNATGSPVLMIVSTIVICTLLMFLNSVLATLFNIQTVMVAIVVMQLYSAIMSQICGASPIKVDYDMCRALETGGFRYAAFGFYVVLCLVLYHLTPIGRRLRFIGGNPLCAVQTGMNPNKAIAGAFMIAGLGVGLASVFTIIRTGSISGAMGVSMGMDVMLATVLGGMSIFGGSKSNAYSGVIGALTVVALNKGLLMIGVSSSIIQGVRGIIFLLLVVLNSERPQTLPSKQQF